MMLDKLSVHKEVAVMSYDPPMVLNLKDFEREMNEFDTAHPWDFESLIQIQAHMTPEEIKSEAERMYGKGNQ